MFMLRNWSNARFTVKFLYTYIGHLFCYKTYKLLPDMTPVYIFTVTSISQCIRLCNKPSTIYSKESSVEASKFTKEASTWAAWMIESLLKSTVLTSPVSTLRMEARYCWFTFNSCCKESVLYARLVAFCFKEVEEYPGIYSLRGVKAIIMVVITKN